MNARLYILALTMISITACADNKPDYKANARCEGAGLKPGTDAFTKCVNEEKSARMMEQQRREYEQMKQYDRDLRMKPY